MYFYLLFSLSASSFKVSNLVTRMCIPTKRSIARKDIVTGSQIMSSKTSLVLVRFNQGDPQHAWYDILDSSRMTDSDKLRSSIDSMISTHHPRPVPRNLRAAYVTPFHKIKQISVSWRDVSSMDAFMTLHYEEAGAKKMTMNAEKLKGVWKLMEQRG
ncbi:hypothetical protein NA56DRAFT_747840 [Hyaloscypha hepaticicola]|uniref:Uncharacterized protein n=1 Tax=Hyaloscypha hepaticicola TaxID=2082293 RepID=A0A2J6Q8K3_9HELO|nr:hypothetical protein NA56DRAFT_747840 [Hyaloscypha hepaticicola]